VAYYGGGYYSSISSIRRITEDYGGLLLHKKAEVAFTAEADTAYYMFLLTDLYDGSCGKVDLRFVAEAPGVHQYLPGPCPFA